MNYIRDNLGLDPKEWLVVKWNPDNGGGVSLENRATGEIRTFDT